MKVKAVPGEKEMKGNTGSNQNKNTGGREMVTGTDTIVILIRGRLPVRGLVVGEIEMPRTYRNKKQKESFITLGDGSVARRKMWVAAVMRIRRLFCSLLVATVKEKTHQIKRNPALSCQGHSLRIPTCSGVW